VPPPRSSRRWCCPAFAVLAALLIVALTVAAALCVRFGADEPVSYPDIERHFKYGSTGGERESGFPFWIWQVLPKVCAKHLPGEGYASIGMIFEPGRTLPVGVSMRRNLGLDRVFLNCAACHTGTVRETPQSEHIVYTGMPANTLDLMGFENFFFNCAMDARFSAEFIIPEIDAQAGKLGLLDRYLVYPVAIGLMRERLLMLRERFGWTQMQPPWGPGRVDTFNSSKVLFNFPAERLKPHEIIGTADFPSIWEQRKRKTRDDGLPMQLHWDGNNTKAEERNKNAAFGTGTTPPTIDLAAIGRIEEWLLDVTPPGYPYPIDDQLAARGATLYGEYCAACHGASGEDFAGEFVGHVTPIDAIGTDRHRLDSFTPALAQNLGAVYAGYPWRFTGFKKTFGYANMPLDGLWLRGPFLHNGSVPTVRDLLEPAANRPAAFCRGYDVFDQEKLGFVSDVCEEGARKYFRYDTTVPGNDNAGHEGEAYGTELPADDKAALVEFLKTF
jgi:mono/diheme cytochrome c family protein